MNNNIMINVAVTLNIPFLTERDPYIFFTKIFEIIKLMGGRQAFDIIIIGRFRKQLTTNQCLTTF